MAARNNLVGRILRQERLRKKPKQPTLGTWSIVRGDTVQVMTGRSKGSIGQVLKVDRKRNTVFVKGANMRGRIVPDSEEMRSEVLQYPSPIHVSNVLLLDPQLNRGTKIRWGFLADGTKVRLSRKTGAVIPKPIFPSRRKPAPGPKDTPAEIVLKKTFVPPTLDNIP